MQLAHHTTHYDIILCNLQPSQSFHESYSVATEG